MMSHLIYDLRCLKIQLFSSLVHKELAGGRFSLNWHTISIYLQNFIKLHGCIIGFR